MGDGYQLRKSLTHFEGMEGSKEIGDRCVEHNERIHNCYCEEATRWLESRKIIRVIECQPKDFHSLVGNDVCTEQDSENR